MDWTKVKRNMYLTLLMHLLWEKYYWKISVFNLFFAGVLFIIYQIFVGNFVQTVSDVKNYLYILIIGTIFSRAFTQPFGTIVRRAAKLRKIVKTYIYGGLSYAFFDMFFWDLKVILYTILGYFILPFLLGYLSLDTLIFIILFSLIIIFSSYSLGLILSPLFIYARKEAQDLIWLISEILEIITPTTFLLSYFFFYKITVFVPPVVLIEEFRKILLFGSFDLEILLQALLISFIYFLVGFSIFKTSFNFARNKGWVKLA